MGIDAHTSRLLSLGWEAVRKEPDRLKGEITKVKHQVEHLAVEHYPSFLQAENALRSIEASLDKCWEGIQRARTKAEDAAKAIPSGRENRCEEGIKEKEKARTALLMHSQLLELLEIPQLVESCIRGSYYEEAMNLSDYADKIVSSLRGVRVVENIAAAVKASIAKMIRALKDSLKGKLSLPLCLTILGHLRRATVWKEAELRQLFLTSRSSYFSTQLQSRFGDDFSEAKVVDIVNDAKKANVKLTRKDLKEVVRENPASFLVKYSDLFREHTFEAVTYYRAVFLSSSETEEGGSFKGAGVTAFSDVRSAPGLSGGGGSSFEAEWQKVWKNIEHQVKAKPKALEKESEDYAASGGASSFLLQNWINRRLSTFLTVVEGVLPAVADGQSLANLVDQIMYSGESLGRIGIDFRPFLLPSLLSAILAFFQKEVMSAVDTFTDALRFPAWLRRGERILDPFLTLDEGVRRRLRYERKTRRNRGEGEREEEKEGNEEGMIKEEGETKEEESEGVDVSSTSENGGGDGGQVEQESNAKSSTVGELDGGDVEETSLLPISDIWWGSKHDELPHLLLLSSPLSSLVNAYLSALNNSRQCIPEVLKEQMANYAFAALVGAVDVLIHAVEKKRSLVEGRRAEDAAVHAKEIDVVVAAFIRIAMPYLYASAKSFFGDDVPAAFASSLEDTPLFAELLSLFAVIDATS
uniref:Conserved oligomeric Golgi complex subunit 8 n=1 Tax=Palpitomonas bilix TaxID=652834 RepID=A0A7S3DFZ5_9EUKA|mmetsp:Transcript_34021/g.87372  ORF Transcript_34021/g.87372 Transcript_34021/m.87372 type:complete len:696 (+) Transcript_34021:145-2232(+)